jgi:hypothetical protein
MKYLIILFLSLLGTSSLYAQNGVYEAYHGTWRPAFELVLQDTIFVARNPAWFVPPGYKACRYNGTVRYSKNRDTLFFTSLVTDAMRADVDTPCYNNNFGTFVRQGQDLIGQHSPPNTIITTYKFLRDTVGLLQPRIVPMYIGVQ